MHETFDPRPSPTGSRWRSALVLAALAVLALALRLARIRYGLPDFLEEAIPLRDAWAMRDVATGSIDWHPHSFNYPSLGLYVHFAVQQLVFGVGTLLGAYTNVADYRLATMIDPTPMVVAARAVGIACDLVAMVAVYRIAERLHRGAGWYAALVVAGAPLLVVTASSIFTDSLMAAASLWAVERMLAWHDGARRPAPVAAAVLIGLAAGAKYPAAALVLPMGYLLWVRFGLRGIPSMLAMGALAAAVFLATSPFIAVDFSAFWRDFSFEAAHAAGGHLGSVGARAATYQFGNLVASLGWVGVLLLACVPIVVVVDRARRAAWIATALAFVAFAVPIVLARIEAERYAVPVVLLAAALAFPAGLAALARTPFAARREVSLLVMALAITPVLAAGVHRAVAAGTTTQVAARRWCEAHLERDALLVQEGYAARLVSFLQKQDVASEPVYAHAAPAMRARFDAIPTFHVVAMPLSVSGRISQRVTDQGRPVELTVFAHASEFNQVFYDARLVAAADFVMTSSAVRGRFEDDPSRYPRENAFYQRLESRGELVARFAPSADTSGPDIRLYRIGARYREGLDDLDARWWTAAIPAAYRAAFETRSTVSPTTQSEPGTLAGEPPPWVQSLSPLYAARVRPFVNAMATELAVLGHDAAARRFARASLLVQPDDVEACLVYSVVCGRLGRWDEAREATTRALGAAAASAEPALVLMNARALARTGATPAALHQLERLVASLAPHDPLRIEAERAIEELAAQHGAQG